jgi:hypothetical protein
MDTTEAYAIGAKHGATTGKVLMLVVKTVAPVAKLSLLGFGVLVLTAAVFPEVTKKEKK